MIEKIRIENYKNFKEFEFEGFKRVNLIAGKNNTGKSNLLEAIYLAETSLVPASLLFFYAQRNSIPLTLDGKNLDPIYSNLQFENCLESYFWKRDRKNPISIQLDEKQIIARFSNFTENPTSDPASGSKSVTLFPTEFFDESNPKISFQVGLERPLYQKFWGYPFNPFSIPVTLDLLFIGPSDFESNNYDRYYNSILISKRKERFHKLLELAFEIEISDFRIIEDFKTNTKQCFVFDREGNFRQIGEFGFGSNRILRMLLFMFNCENKKLFIDEIDSGIHYSKQVKFWELIFSAAEELNVQLFTTTHSRDCFEAFAKVSNENQGQGQFIRLQERGGEIQAVSYNETERMRAVEFKSEVR
jgi:AAA15 family ATPase/GTPase